MKKNTVRGAVIATALAGLLSTGMTAAAYAADSKDDGVKCAGINSCKGTGGCKSAKNECKGHNGCKGQGWMKVKDEAECKSKGGTVVK